MSGSDQRPTARQLYERVRGGQNAVVRNLVGPRGEEAVIDVTMLGTVGAGKTTLLASMYERFGRVIGSTDLAVRPADHSTSVTLQGYITELKNISRSLRAQGGIAGTGSVREYPFGVGRKGHPPLFTLRFTDYPGKYLINPRSDGGEKLQRALTRADVVVVAIDVPALVERNGRYHDGINTPQIITDMIMRMAEQDLPRLILLAPLKCERYVGTAEEARRLGDRIVEAYRPLLDHIGSGRVRERVACVLAPVQTVGSVVFSSVEEDRSGHPVFHFRARRVGAAYAPVDTDQLLRYTLRFVVNKYRTDQRGLVRRVWEQVIGTDAALLAAVEEFAAGCKTEDGFMVLQDHPLLQPGRPA